MHRLPGLDLLRAIAIVWVLVAGCMKYFGVVTIGTGV